MSNDEQLSLYQIWDNTNWCRGTLTNSNHKYTQIAIFYKYNTKEPKVYKYQILNVNCTQLKERVTNQIQKLQQTKREQITKPQNKTKRQQTSLIIPNYNPQISNNQTKRVFFFSHTLSNFL